MSGAAKRDQINSKSSLKIDRFGLTRLIHFTSFAQALQQGGVGDDLSSVGKTRNTWPKSVSSRQVVQVRGRDVCPKKTHVFWLNKRIPYRSLKPQLSW